MALKPGSIIRTNEFLSVDDYIESPQRKFYAIMQGDGNFVVYRGTRDDPQGALWHTNSYGAPGKYYAIMQGDGNFAVYKGAPPPPKRGALWHTKKHGAKGDFFAVIQDDGNFVVYKGTSLTEYQEVWWSADVTVPIDRSWWMGDLSEQIGTLPIKNVVIPGTHDSNTETTNWKGDDFVGSFAPVYILRAQERSPRDQLRDGIRYFDLRYKWRGSHPVVYHGHCSTRTDLNGTMQTIKEFVESHPTEIVILNLSNWNGMDPDRHQQAANCIISYLGEKMVYWGKDPNHDYKGSPNVTVNELHAAEKNVIVVYHKDGSYHPQDDKNINGAMRFWREESIFSPWPDTRAHDVLARAMKKNLKDRKTCAPKALFALQAQLTPPGNMAAIVPKYSLYTMAKQTNPKVIEWLQKWTTDGDPNGDPPISAQEARENLNIVIVDFYNIGGKDKTFVGTLLEMNMHWATD
jgi:hypothetical protein